MLMVDGWRKGYKMSNYTNIIYPHSSSNTYPQKLCRYLFDRFYSSGKKILDVGCGKGTHIKLFEDLGLDGYGVDLRVGSTDKIKKCNVETENISFEENMFDYVFSKSLVEHVNNIDNLFTNIFRVLKPNGVFVCMTPDWKSQMSHFWDDYTHVHPFTRKSLKNSMLINGFKDVRCEYFYQLPFLWNRPYLNFVPVIINLVTTQNMKWKDEDESNGRDNKLIRFSKEKMLLAYGIKEKNE